MSDQWIKIKRTFNVGTALYVKDERRQLDEAAIKTLPKGSFQKTCAPEDDNVDTVAVKLADRKAETDSAFAKANRLRAAADLSLRGMDTLHAALEAKQAAADQAGQISTDISKQYFDLSEKKNPGANEKKALKKLEAERGEAANLATRTLLEADCSDAHLKLAEANVTLKLFDADTALARARSLAEKYGLADPTETVKENTDDQQDTEQTGSSGEATQDGPDSEE